MFAEDEEVKEEAKTEKKRIEVIWNELKFEFVWRVGTPPQLLVFRLSRMLDPLADPGRLILHFSDGLFAELCDALESGVSLQAKFLEHHPPPVIPLQPGLPPVVASPVGGGGNVAPLVPPQTVPGQSLEVPARGKRAPAASKSPGLQNVSAPAAQCPRFP